MRNSLLRILVVLSFLPFWQSTPFQAQNAQYISPLPGSIYNPSGTTIAIRYGDQIESSSLSSQQFSVQGSRSGVHSGKTLLALDHRTIIFKPAQPFAPGETVFVTLQSGVKSVLGQSFGPVSFSFNISKKTSPEPAATLQNEILAETLASKTAASAKKTAVANTYLTTPYNFPPISINVATNQVADGYIFTTGFQPSLANNNSFLLMLDNNGQPVFYQKMPGNSFALDFKLLPDGNLAYWDSNNLSYDILDSSYNRIDTISAQNGFISVDLHELQLLPNGDYLYMIYDPEPVNMQSIVPGGDPNATVTGLIIQEIDPQKNVVFQWSSWDHIPITDSNQDLTAASIDYVHGNALELDKDNNILLSSRHLDEITKINHQTGAIIWRMGGKQNQFVFSSVPSITDNPRFYYQHDIRRLDNGDLTLFDNHNLHDSQFSRAREYVVDETAKTAQLVWEYYNSPTSFSPYMGNTQRLPNGNTLVGWGGNPTPTLTEVKPDGTKVFELTLDGTSIVYRSFRFTWHGFPTWSPALVLTSSGGSSTLTFSWNGATEISSYQVFGGNTNPPDQLLGQPAKAGFETSFQLNATQGAYCYFRVMPIDNQSMTTQFSHTIFNPACGSTIYLPYLRN